ncbi:MAG: T9SS type A sorting domain-containing protein [Ignavibacteriales bacterium]|nr:T9SS type A sorting domain-containing protein [Ignavibacteriales bacterium]
MAVFILLEASDSVSVAQMFAPKAEYNVGLRPYNLVSADFDGDGDFDLATGSTGAFESDGIATVCVLINNGDGTFAAPATYNVGDAPSLAEADLDGDGDIDLVAADYYTNSVSILLNNGAGVLVVTGSFASGGINAHKLCAPDLDGDGDNDLAVPNSGSGNLSIFFNNGNAVFTGPVLYAAGIRPNAVISADLDSDGDADLVVTNNGSASVSVMLNNGNGTSAAKVDYTVRSYPQSPSVADYNGDGCLDLAVPNAWPGTPFVSVLMGNCDGSFDLKVDWPGCRPHTVASADYDDDGDVDMAVTNNECNSVSIFLNNGDGTFAPHFTLPTGIGPQHVVAEDFDGDGNIDLATSNFDNNGTPGNTISVFINQIVTSVSDQSAFPETYSLDQNFPNPFNPSTLIRYSVPLTTYVSLKVYTMLGREVAVLVNQETRPGSYQVTWEATGLPCGVYFYRLHAGSFVQTKKLVSIR